MIMRMILFPCSGFVSVHGNFLYCVEFCELYNSVMTILLESIESKVLRLEQENTELYQIARAEIASQIVGFATKQILLDFCKVVFHTVNQRV
jgi:hypothetical protein